MSTNGVAGRINRKQWFTMNPADVDPEVLQRCTVQAVQAGLGEFTDAHVLSVEVNQTGQFQVPPDPIIDFAPGFDGHTEKGLPDFCQVIVGYNVAGGHQIEIEVWVPLIWNGRFVGCGGGGNRLRTSTLENPALRMVTLPDGIRNGFAAATSDGGYGKDMRFIDWQLDQTTGELDWKLVENWAHRSTHLMTLVGKAVTSAIHGEQPRWSYFAGTSGGGRQAVVQAQQYADDYDGMLATDPAINWTRFIPAELWGPMVMKEHHALGPEKLNAFRRAAVEGMEAGFPADLNPTFDASAVVGQETDEGQVTEQDAAVMQLIWDGPRTTSGEWLWYGLLPGAESWGVGINGAGLLITDGEDEKRHPLPFALSPSWFGSWLQNDETFDWQTLTMQGYVDLFQRSIDEMKAYAADDPDLSGLPESGHKLLITHGTNDEVIFPQGTAHYYRRVVEAAGPGGVDDYFRVFFCPGDGHSTSARGHDGTVGAALDISTALSALMRWVESAEAPEDLTLFSFDAGGDEETGSVKISRYTG